MDFLQHLLTFGPQLLTNLIAWIGAALAFVAAIIAWRGAKNDRSALVSATLASGEKGGLKLEAVNLGKRFALDVLLKDDEGTVLARHGGVQGGSAVWLVLPAGLASPAAFELLWTDADGRERVSVAAFELIEGLWRRKAAPAAI